MSETLSMALSLTAVGLSMVFLVLGVLIVTLKLARRLDEGWHAAEREAAVVDPDAVASIDHVTLAIISAAVAVAVGRRFQMRAVRRLLPRARSNTGWAAQGRAQLQTSHTLNRETKK